MKVFKTGQQTYKGSTTPFSVKPNENNYKPMMKNNPMPPTRTDEKGYQDEAQARDWSSKDLTPPVKPRSLEDRTTTEKLLSMNPKDWNKDTPASRIRL